jgi:hypothetical protein
MPKIIPDKIFRNIPDQRYLWIHDYARNLYNARMENVDKSTLSIEHIRTLINDIYYENEELFKTNIDEKHVFYLNLLVDSEKIFEKIISLYETYLEESNINEFEMLEYYEKNGFKEKIEIIIEAIMNIYGLRNKEARSKINDAIHYNKIKQHSTNLNHCNSDKIKKKKKNKVRNKNKDYIDLLTEMKNYISPFDTFILPNEIASYEDRSSKTR